MRASPGSSATCPGSAISWFKMAPGLFEDSSPSPTLAFVELLRALVLSGTQPRLVGSLVWRQQTRPRPPTNATFKPTIVALSTRGARVRSTRSTRWPASRHAARLPDRPTTPRAQTAGLKWRRTIRLLYYYTRDGRAADLKWRQTSMRAPPHGPPRPTRKAWRAVRSAALTCWGRQ